MKVLSWKFDKSFEPFNLSTFKGRSETVFLRERSDQVFDSLQFPKQSSCDDNLFFSKCLKFDVDSKNGTN